MEEDEETTVRTMESYRKTVSSLIEQHDGTVIDSPGDNLLSEFASVVDAVQCAVEIQHVIKAKNAVVPEARRMQFRIGVSLEDIIDEEGRIYGDGVNIASRIEGLADAGGICISGRAYDHIANKLALGYEDIGEHPVKNISAPVQVYRIPMDTKATSDVGIKKVRLKRLQWVALAFLAAIIVSVGSVTVWDRYLRPSAPLEVARPEAAVTPAEKPSIAVLPFDNMGGDPEQEYFSDGMTEEIITRLSKSPRLLVIARNSTFFYKGKQAKTQQVAEELGARYVIEGSVRKAGDMVRITAQMIDAETDKHLWADSFDRDIGDVFGLQDEIAKQIASNVLAESWSSETIRARRIPTDNLTAYDSLLRGWDQYRKDTKEENEKARQFFRKAIELDAEYAQAYASLGHTHLADFLSRGDLDALDRAFELAEKVIALDDSVADGHLLLSDAYSHRGKYMRALTAAQRALELDPSNAACYEGLAARLVVLNRPREAIETLEEAIRLNPKYPVSYLQVKTYAYMFMGRFDEEIAAAEEILTRNPKSVPAHFFLSHGYRNLWMSQQTNDPRVLDEALEMAEKAVALEEASQWTQIQLILCHLWRKQYGTALTSAKEAISLMPNAAAIHYVMGDVLLSLGRYRDAIETFRRCSRLDPSPWYRAMVDCRTGSAYRLMGHHAESEATLKQALTGYDQILSNEKEPHLELAILYGEMGRIEEARIEAEKLSQLWPGFSLETWGQREPIKDKARLERDMAALRKAGLK